MKFIRKNGIEIFFFIGLSLIIAVTILGFKEMQQERADCEAIGGTIKTHYVGKIIYNKCISE